MTGVQTCALPISIVGDSKLVSDLAPLVDLVYIDADHSYEGCTQDIRLYRSKAKMVLCGDDYIDRPGFGVIRAVTEALPVHKHSGQFWWFEL